jgi:cellulose synthase/poly-beta-1,6-N-acetylglucosamine synthase-like glycosyltransferase
VSASPLISVIVPTRNRPASLQECLSSLAAQDYLEGRWEIIVVNDGGPPPWSALSPDLLARIPLRMEDQDPAGPAAARNRGLRLARGSLVAFTDDDCRVFPDWLSQWAAGFDGRPWDALGGRTLNAVPQRLGAQAQQYLVDFMYEYMRFGNGDAYLIVTNNAAFRREAVERAGGFDESFPHAAAEDRDLSHRMAHAGHRLGFWPQARVWHDNPLTSLEYLRIQYRYGRGDAIFRRKLAHDGIPRRIGQRRRPQFHLALAKKLWTDRAPLAMWLLMYNSQAMHYLGSLFSRISHRGY